MKRIVASVQRLLSALADVEQAVKVNDGVKLQAGDQVFCNKRPDGKGVGEGGNDSEGTGAQVDD